MKKIVITIISLMLFSSTLFAEEKVPEFDGGYVKLSDGKFIEMEAQKAYTTQIARGGMSVMRLMSLPRTYYTTSKKSMISVNSDEFKGIAIRGNYKFKNFSLHPLKNKKLDKNEALFDNQGPAKKTSTLYTNGKELKIRSKSLGKDTYFFASKEKLEKGEYVAWLGKYFWFFKIK